MYSIAMDVGKYRTYGIVERDGKITKDGVEVPQICKEFNIDPASWRDVSLKYSLLK